MKGILVLSTTFESKNDAEKMASIVLKKRLAGCVQISGPVVSMYWWQGMIERSNEYILTLKTHLSLYEKVETIVKQNHPYDTPEIIATTVSHCSEEYGKWLHGELENENIEYPG